MPTIDTRFVVARILGPICLRQHGTQYFFVLPLLALCANSGSTITEKYCLAI